MNKDNPNMSRRKLLKFGLVGVGVLALEGCMPATRESTASPTATPSPAPSPSPTTEIAPTPTPIEANPLHGKKLYVDPNSSAARAFSELQNTDPAKASAIKRIAEQPHADWFGNWITDIQSAVDSRATAAYAAGAIPVMVAYNVPQRDDGGYSAGGAASYKAYLEWVDQFVAGLKGREAVVIYEPDALGLLPNNRTPDQQQQRLELMGNAITRFTQAGNVKVYVEAAQWVDPATMAERLKAVGIEKTAGVSVNTSGFAPLEQNLQYMDGLRAHFPGGLRGVIDTSRNGAPVPTNSIYNPPEARLGHAPTTETGQPDVDAYLWIKPPGESDGGDSPAGMWSNELALKLAGYKQ